MKPFLLKLPLQRKEPELRFDACQVDHVVELSDQAFREFKHNLLADRDFLRDFNRKYASPYTEGVRPGLLVLGEGSDDGVFVCTEGYDYARYSAYVPNARLILMMKEYPTLQAYNESMAAAVDRRLQKVLALSPEDDYRIFLRELDGETRDNHLNDELFLDMLYDRPEIADMQVDRDEVTVKIAPEYLPQREQPLRTISEEDIKVACAKHLLWSYDAGGEQADFSNCRFDEEDFSGMELNGAIFDGSQFKNCNLSNASLCFASFKGCSFVDCNCHAWVAEEGVFQNAVFDHCDLKSAIMTHSDFSGATLQDCEMGYSSLQNCLIADMKMEDCCVRDINRQGTTKDAAEWFHQAPPDLSMEEQQ